MRRRFGRVASPGVRTINETEFRAGVADGLLAHAGISALLANIQKKIAFLLAETHPSEYVPL
jgi:hypothetical protein